MVLTNYESICGIVYYSILNIISTDRANYRLINTSVYLFIYQLDIHYIPGRLNFISNAFLRFHVLGNDVVRENNIESVLDVL